MSSPTTTPNSTQKKSRMGRIGTSIRRNSSFFIPSRSNSPSARGNGENSAGTGTSTPPKQSSLPIRQHTTPPPSKPTSRPSSIRSIRSIERFVKKRTSFDGKDKKEAEQKKEEQRQRQPDPEPQPAEQPKEESQVIVPPAEPIPEPAPEPKAEPPTDAANSTATSSAAPTIDIQPPKQEELAPEPTPEPEVEVLKKEEPQEIVQEEKKDPVPHETTSESVKSHESQEHLPYGGHVHIPISSSPEPLSAANSSDNLSQDNHSVHDHTPAFLGHTKTLSLNISQEHLPTELSPILEDERSAVEEKPANPPFINRVVDTTVPQVSSALRAPPITAPSLTSHNLSNTSNVTTPRAKPELVSHVAKGQNDEKGKGKDSLHPTFSIPGALPQEGYFAPTAPEPIAHASTLEQCAEDPFRDPDPVDVYSSMPVPDTQKPVVESQPAVANPSFPDPVVEPTPAIYTLPAFKEVITRDLRTVPSDHTLAAQSSRASSEHRGVETDETVPLLSRSKQPFHSPWVPNYQSNSWLTHTLPDSTKYYTHPAMRIVTDINIQNPRKMAAVTSYIEKKLAVDMSIPADGLEIWLHDEAVHPDDFVPVRCWVNHEARALGYWPPPTFGPDGSVRPIAEDKLNLEYRYWAFMESHPAHTSLPFNAYSEALDALTWSYTERLLKSNRRAPPPFTQHESQELITLLRSTTSHDTNVQSVVQTRVVARILRRIVQWKQHFFRPQKPLPSGTPAEASETQESGSNQYSVVDIILATLCLGIPYLLTDRPSYSRYDEEGGIMYSHFPFLLFGASICILAAIILMASLMFLTLPGLDDVARTTAFIAIIGSMSSLASSVIAALRNRLEIQLLVPRGGEGFVVTNSTINGNSIIPSLPAVFLLYSIISLVTGVVLYVSRGSVVIDPTPLTKFAAYTRWTTIGVAGFCGGVLIASMLFIRR